MVDEICTLIWNLSGIGKESRGKDGGCDLTNVQYKPIWNSQNESFLYNEYMIIKIKLEIRHLLNDEGSFVAKYHH
jgi:hypothetical protein